MRGRSKATLHALALVIVSRNFLSGHKVDMPGKRCVELALPYLLHEGIAPRTYDDYAETVNHHVVPHIGHVVLAKLTPQDVQRMIAGVTKSISPQMAVRCRRTLRAALTRAMKWGYIARNVAALTDAPKVVQREMTALAPTDARKLLAAVHGERLEALYTVALALGLRQGEALGLRWQDGGLVFTSTIGTPVDEHNLRKQFRALVMKAGLPHMRFHDLRHSAALLLAAQGATARDVMETLGHTQITTTMNLYTHVFTERKTELADMMDAALTSIPRKSVQ